MSIIAPKQVGLTAAIADTAASGPITLPAGTFSEQYRQLRLAQATAGVVATIPDPSDTSIEFGLIVTNEGAESISLYGTTITTDSFAKFVWDGSQWLPDAGPNNTPEVTEELTPTALNTIPDLASARLPGSDVTIFVNGNLVYNSGITIDAAGVVTVVPAALTYNVQATDVISVIYSPAI